LERCTGLLNLLTARQSRFESDILRQKYGSVDELLKSPVSKTGVSYERGTGG
jgi:hypothetical protein